jgi:CRISPR-associated endonuclease/helicase Cas3
LIENPIAATEDFIDNVFRKRWSKKKSCLIVVNTVSRSIELFHKIKEHLKENDYENPIEYLSTNITPKDRLSRIGKIRDLLENKKAPILIATQVVEAGVDLDFDIGFRDLGPIDSIIQVAGRINRNFNAEKQFAPLFIVDFGDCQKIYKTLSTIQAKQALSGKQNIPEPAYLDLIEAYFQGVSEKKSFDQFNKLFEAMEKLQYESDSDEPSVSNFRIIEESTTTQSVYIEADEEASFLKEMYFKMIKKEISTEEYQEKYKLKFQQNILGVPNYLTVDLTPINNYDDNLRLVPFELLDEYYDSKTGFIRKKADYLKMF